MQGESDLGVLRAARRSRGWSLTDAAHQLVALGAARGVSVATPRSLRSQLSRWENGHVLPDATYRALLADLLDRSPAALGIEPPVVPTATAVGSPADRLRGALAAAPTDDGPALDRWREQLATAERLDDELGTAAADDIVAALVHRLDRLLLHTVTGPARTGLAEVLSRASALAGAHALDRGDVDEAWRHYARARSVAREVASPHATAVAVSGLVEVLVDLGEPDRALPVLDEAAPGESRSGGVAETRLAAAAALVHAASGRSTDALAALARAQSGVERAGVAPDRLRLPGPPINLADLHRWRGRTLRLLNHSGASAELEQALTAGPRSVRHRAEVLADLAATLGGTDPDGAARHTREARALTERIGSTRIAARLSR